MSISLAQVTTESHADVQVVVWSVLPPEAMFRLPPRARSESMFPVEVRGYVDVSDLSFHLGLCRCEWPVVACGATLISFLICLIVKGLV